MQEPLPMNFKMPQLESNHGITDSVDHLESFKSLMLICKAIDAALCRTFLSTLKYIARYWYTSLKRSILSIK